MAKIISINEFQEITPKGRYSTIKEYYRLIPNALGANLNSQDREIFDLLADFTKNGATAQLDYPWLQDRFGKSQKTIRRILKKLANLFEYNFVRFIRHRGLAQYCKLFIKRTESFGKIISSAIENLETKASASPGENVRTSGQKCPHLRTSLSTSYYKTNIDKEEISCKETRAREANIPPAQRIELENKAAEISPFLLGENSSLEEKEANFTAKVEKQTNQEQEEIDMPKYQNPKDLELELNYQLSQKFSLEKCKEFSKHFKFNFDNELSQLTMMHEVPLNFTSAEKEILKQIISSVYGSNIKLVSQKCTPKTTLGTRYLQKESVLNPEINPAWSKVKTLLAKSIEPSLVKMWLDKITVEFNEDEKKLLARVNGITYDWIYSHQHRLEEILKELGYCFELTAQNNGQNKTLKLPFVKWVPAEGEAAFVFDAKTMFKAW